MTTVGAGSPACVVIVGEHSFTAFKGKCVCSGQMAEHCRARAKDQRGHQD